MSLYTLQPNDDLPSLKLPAGLVMKEVDDIDLLAALATISREEVVKRIANDHVAYVAFINAIPAGFGWMARGKATIGELNHEIVLPLGHRYLWNFRTLEAFRGAGIYPALLQYIIEQERNKASRFWIIHAPENNSSLRGIEKAGFQFVGKLYRTDASTQVESTALSNDLQHLLTEMDITVSDENSVSCWNCSSPFLRKRKKECCCSVRATICVGNNLLSLAS